jgi:hypothetical protein
LGRVPNQRFGISAASEFFQKRMSETLEGFPGVVCHMDDMLDNLMSLKKQAPVLSAGMHFLGPCPKSTRYLLSVIRESASSIL